MKNHDNDACTKFEYRSSSRTNPPMTLRKKCGAWLMRRNYSSMVWIQTHLIDDIDEVPFFEPKARTDGLILIIGVLIAFLVVGSVSNALFDILREGY